MIEVAFGQIGIPPQEFWRMSLKEFRLTQRGFFERLKQERQTAWEQTRFMAFYILKPHAKRGRLNNFNDLVEFEWEKEARKNVELPTKQEMEYFARKSGKFIDANGNFHN